MPLLTEGGLFLTPDRLIVESSVPLSVVAAWPNTINVTNFGSYGETPDTNFAEFAPDVGPPKRRRRMSISSDTLTFSMIMTSAEYATFLTFYRTTLQDGSLPFTFPRPRNGIIHQWVFTGQAPQCKFADYGLWEVTMTMRSIPGTDASWLPLLTNTSVSPSLSIAPDIFSDFTTEGGTTPEYWAAGFKYSSFSR
jgi:hypothetical protein